MSLNLIELKKKKSLKKTKEKHTVKRKVIERGALLKTPLIGIEKLRVI